MKRKIRITQVASDSPERNENMALFGAMIVIKKSVSTASSDTKYDDNHGGGQAMLLTCPRIVGRGAR